VNLAITQTADPNRHVDAPMDIREQIAQCVRTPVRIAPNAIPVRIAAYIATVARTTINAVRQGMVDAH